jgi:hypothetical protein
MTRFFSSLSILAMALSAQAFTPSAGVARRTALSVANPPYFLDEQQPDVAPAPTPQRKPTPNKKATPQNKHKDGLFSPLVYLGKTILGEDELNRIRGNVIAKHSEVIKGFVSTAETAWGTRVLKLLFELADQNHNGAIEYEELTAALHSLGFNFLNEKQIRGIFERAGGVEKGFLTLEEFLAEAPKTLKTNLVKLAKTNGGELGFLV